MFHTWLRSAFSVPGPSSTAPTQTGAGPETGSIDAGQPVDAGSATTNSNHEHAPSLGQMGSLSVADAVARKGPVPDAVPVTSAKIAAGEGNV